MSHKGWSSDDIVRGGWAGLSAGHGINQVINADDLEVHIAARGVNQVIAADRKQVAIAGIDHHIQLGIRQLQPGGEGNRAAVRVWNESCLT